MSVFSALKRGDFYCSTGPKFEEISIDGPIVRVVSSPVAYVGVSTDTRLLFAKRVEDDLLTDTCFDIKWYLDLAEQGINEHQ